MSLAITIPVTHVFCVSPLHSLIADVLPASMLQHPACSIAACCQAYKFVFLSLVYMFLFVQLLLYSVSIQHLCPKHSLAPKVAPTSMLLFCLKCSTYSLHVLLPHLLVSDVSLASMLIVSVVMNSLASKFLCTVHLVFGIHSTFDPHALAGSQCGSSVDAHS